MPRLYLYVALAFVTSFVGGSWAARGFPMHWSGPVSTSSLQPTATATFGDQSTRDYERRKRESEHTAQGDTKPSLDKIRLEALQAATGFELSPCDSSMKKNLIEALTAYTRAWQTTVNCPVMAFCTDEKLNAAAATFSTPLDRRVKEAFHRAFAQPGIVKADFPASVRYHMLQFAGPGLWAGYESPVCDPRMRTTTRRVR